VLDIFPVARQALLPLVVLALSFREIGVAVLVVVSALFIGYRALAWSRFSYAVVDGTLRIEHGIIQRHVREVPVTRIQQVDLRRQLRHRVAGVVAVRIDTAGGGSGAEVVLDCLSDAAALALRAELLDPRHRTDPAAAPGSPPVGVAHPPGPDADGRWIPPPPPPPVGAGSGWTGPPPGGTVPGLPVPGLHPGAGPGFPGAVPPVSGTVAGQVLARLSTRDLVISGITGSGLLAGLSIVGFAFLVLGELPDAAAEEVGGRVAALFGTVLVVAVALIVALPVFLAVAAGASILRDHGFTLVRYGNDLHVQRGLLDQREATLALHRIQAVWVLDNPVRRRLGLVSVQLQSAGSGSDVAGQVATTTIPLVRRSDLAAVLTAVLPSIADPVAVPSGPPDAAGPASAAQVGVSNPVESSNQADASDASDIPVPGAGGDRVDLADSALAAGPFAGLPVRLAAAPAAARRRSVVRFVAPVPVVALLLGLFTRSPWTALVVLLAVPAGALGLARFRALAHGITSGTVVARSGALIHRTALVPIARTQSHRVESSPFQRRLGLATLTIQVAGRGRTVALVDLYDHRCRVVGDHALGSAEARRDELAVRRRTLGQLERSATSTG
jgi:uncharacterized membrane protein YdbT with pleckstrin-like domain